MAKCSEPGCEIEVTQKGHALCLEHWKQKQNGAGYLSASDLAREFDLDSPARLNRVFRDLGWIAKSGTSGWKPTKQGLRLKAKGTRHVKDKVDFVLWPAGIRKSRILQRALEELLSIEQQSAPATSVEEAPAPAYAKPNFAEKYPAPLRTSDGHMVRSQGEIIIDNWLYEHRIVHSYERLVPIDEQMRCDFYLPEIGERGAYIEYWGLESNPQYRERKQEKIELYKANDLKLIEIHASDIGSLDDFLQPALIKLGYQVK